MEKYRWKLVLFCISTVIVSTFVIGGAIGILLFGIGVFFGHVSPYDPMGIVFWSGITVFGLIGLPLIFVGFVSGGLCSAEFRGDGSLCEFKDTDMPSVVEQKMFFAKTGGKY